MITKTSLQTIHAFVELAKLPKNQFESSSAIAVRIKAPPNYLGKMLQSFCIKELVISQKGHGGGFCLAKSPKKIKLIDIVDPIENITRKTGCFLGQPKCSDSHPCQVHNKWKAAQDAYLRFLEETTLAELVVH